MRAAVGHDK